MSQATQDIYQTVTDQIVAAIEKGAGDWHMPWHVKASSGDAMPFNVTSRKHYRGINTIVLWSAARAHGYETNEWGTYKQWAEKKAQVRKGEHGTLIVFWKFFDQKSTDDAGNETTKTVPMARGYVVFNAAQVDNYAAKPAAPVSEPERNAAAEAWFAALGANVSHGGSRAFYSPAADRIQMPDFAAFTSPAHYYATLAHEFIHWTGHASRCDRQLTGRFGDEAYAAEELIAELGAAFQCAILSLDSAPRQDHAAYIASWLKVLRNDKRAIFTAASRAQTAVDWIEGKQGAQAEEPEMMMMAA